MFKLLVLCTGNICRSPVAEAIFATKLRDLDGICVSSRGLNAPIGLRPHVSAVAAAQLLGYTVAAEKRSAQVAHEDISQANLILVMEHSHKRQLREQWRVAEGNTFLLGHWSVGEISDPIGQPISEFIIVNQKIEEACEAWSYRLRTAGLTKLESFKG